MCGEETLIYTIHDNAPICDDCIPNKQIKKIMNEQQMINKILENQR